MHNELVPGLAGDLISRDFHVGVKFEGLSPNFMLSQKLLACTGEEILVGASALNFPNLSHTRAKVFFAIRNVLGRRTVLASGWYLH